MQFIQPCRSDKLYIQYNTTQIQYNTTQIQYNTTQIQYNPTKIQYDLGICITAQIMFPNPDPTNHFNPIYLNVPGDKH